MDPLSILGVASNVVQLVDFSSRLIAGTVELYTSIDGSKRVNRELEVMTKDLNRICGELRDSPRCTSDSELALVALTRSCNEIGQELISVLQGLKVKDARQKWTTFRQALKSAWKESKIRDYENRLKQYRSQITIHLVSLLSVQFSTGVRQVTERLDDISRDQAATSLKLGAHLLDGQMNIANTLDILAASHRDFEIATTNTVSSLRVEILDTLNGVRPGNDGNIYVNKSVVDCHLASQLSALMTEAQVLSRDLKVIKSLKFQDISERRTRIFDAHPNTFEWLFDETIAKNTIGEAEQIVPFLEWLEVKTGVYWLSGKAGSGKSTLMKFLGSHQKTKAALKNWAGAKTLVTASFFFWNIGTRMQKSQEGLLQTLLYDILRQVPSLIRVVCPAHWNSDEPQQPEWTHAEILKTLRNLRKQTLDTIRFCFFIDGLDEYQGMHSDIIELVDQLTSGGDIKVVVSSRPWNVFEDAYGHNPSRSLRLQDLTRNDMTCFVRDHLEKDQRFRQLKVEDRRYEDLVQEIVDKSSGVFLWVFLVVRSLRRGFTNHDTVSELQERLRTLPTELEVYFGHMLNAIERVYHKQAARLLLISLHCPGTLTVMTASYFDENDVMFGVSAEFKPTDPGALNCRTDSTARRIKARCTDLLEIRWDTVDFLHRTVYEFLDLPETRRFLDQRAGNDFDACNYLCNATLCQIKAPPIERDGLVYYYIPQSIDCLVHELMYHAEELDTRGQLDTRLLDDLKGSVEFRRQLKLTCDQNSWASLFLENEGERNWMIALAVCYGIDSYIHLKSDYIRHSLKERATIFNHSLLAIALRLINKDVMHDAWISTPLKPCVVETMLKLGADPNECTQNTPILCAYLMKMPKDLPPKTRAPYLSIAEMLLSSGVSIDSTQYSELEPLLFQSFSSEEATHLRRLIEGAMAGKTTNREKRSIEGIIADKTTHREKQIYNAGFFKKLSKDRERR